MKRRKIVGMESCKKVGSLPGIHCKSKETPHNPNLAGYKNHRVKQFCRRLVAPHMTALRKTEVVVGCHKTGEVGEVRRKTVEAAEARRKTAEAGEEEQEIQEWEPVAKRCLCICVRAKVGRYPMEISWVWLLPVLYQNALLRTMAVSPTGWPSPLKLSAVSTSYEKIRIVFI